MERTWIFTFLMLSLVICQIALNADDTACYTSQLRYKSTPKNTTQIGDDKNDEKNRGDFILKTSTTLPTTLLG